MIDWSVPCPRQAQEVRKYFSLSLLACAAYRSTVSLPGAVPSEAAAATEPGMHFTLWRKTDALTWTATNLSEAP